MKLLLPPSLFTSNWKIAWLIWIQGILLKDRLCRKDILIESLINLCCNISNGFHEWMWQKWKSGSGVFCTIPSRGRIYFHPLESGLALQHASVKKILQMKYSTSSESGLQEALQVWLLLLWLYCCFENAWASLLDAGTCSPVIFASHALEIGKKPS